MRKSIYISLSEAFDLIGDGIFRQDWSTDIIDDPDHDWHMEIELQLRDAIASGRISATYTDWSQASANTLEIRPVDTQCEFFRINVVKGRIYWGPFPEGVEPQVHRLQLQEYLANAVNVGRNTINLRQMCTEHLIATIRGMDGCPYPKDQMIADMQLKFPGISKDTVQKARSEAIRATGRNDLAKPGRRPNT